MMEVALISNMDPVNIGLGCSDKPGPVTSLKPRKKTMTSVYLKFFETAADGKTRRCKFCGQSYSIATATGYFLPYLLLIITFCIISSLRFIHHNPLLCEDYKLLAFYQVNCFIFALLFSYVKLAQF